LLSLPESARETIIAERYEKRKEMLERLALRREMEREKDGNKHTRKSRTSSKRVKSKASALSDLRRRRRASKEGQSANNPMYSSDGESSNEEENENKFQEFDTVKGDMSDEEFVIKVDKERTLLEDSKPIGNEESLETKVFPASPLKREEMQSICLTRNYLEKKAYEPYFDAMVVGLFVRIGIGQHNDHSIYRLAVISDVKEANKPYLLGKKNVNKYLVLQHGSSSKTFSMEHISNQPPTEGEWQRWLNEMQKENLPIMTSKVAKEKLDRLERYRTYVKTDHEVSLMVELKRRLNAGPVNLAAERAKLRGALEVAKDHKDQEEINKIKSQLEEIEKKIQRGENRQKNQDKAAVINQRHRELEVSLQRMASNAAITASSSTIDPDLDPFSRRQTKPNRLIIGPVEPTTLEINVQEIGSDLHHQQQHHQQQQQQQIAQDRMENGTFLKQESVPTVEVNKVVSNVDLPSIELKNPLENESTSTVKSLSVSSLNRDTKLSAVAKRVDVAPEMILKQAHDFDLDQIDAAAVLEETVQLSMLNTLKVSTMHNKAAVSAEYSKPIRRLSVDEYFRRRGVE